MKYNHIFVDLWYPCSSLSGLRLASAIPAKGGKSGVPEKKNIDTKFKWKLCFQLLVFDALVYNVKNRSSISSMSSSNNGMNNLMSNKNKSSTTG